jgi:DNA replication licensing factor MCM7
MYFKPRSTDKAVSVREVRPESLGGLVTIRGMVTRVSNVKPLAAVIALSCDKCGSEVFQEVASGDVTPITECPSEECVRNNARGKLYLQTRACKFLKFQEVKIQELVIHLYY